MRVLRIHYGPGEKSVMHSHPAAVAVFLTNSNNKFTFPDGKSEVSNNKAGAVVATPAGPHLPENVGDKPSGQRQPHPPPQPKTSSQTNARGGSKS